MAQAERRTEEMRDNQEQPIKAPTKIEEDLGAIADRRFPTIPEDYTEPPDGHTSDEEEPSSQVPGANRPTKKFKACPTQGEFPLGQADHFTGAQILSAL